MGAVGDADRAGADASAEPSGSASASASSSPSSAALGVVAPVFGVVEPV